VQQQQQPPGKAIDVYYYALNFAAVSLCRYWVCPNLLWLVLASDLTSAVIQTRAATVFIRCVRKLE